MTTRKLTAMIFAIFSCTLFCAIGMEMDRPKEDQVKPRLPLKIQDEHLENTYKMTDKIWGGAEPHDEAAFQSLKTLGVKTILSVDGAKPDVELAQKYGLRYVHIPIGYDEVPAKQGREIARACNELPSPIYVHCHHGKHRGPAAAAVACIINGTLTNDEALVAMKTFGTGENYTGLWDSARQAAPVDRLELMALNVNFVESAPVQPMAETMIEIDRCLTHLTICKDAGWFQPKDHPDLDPAHETLKLREMLTETMRTDNFKQRAKDFKQWMQSSEKNAQKLEDLLRTWNQIGSKNQMLEIEAALKGVQQSCKDCHAKYRNVRQHP